MPIWDHQLSLNEVPPVVSLPMLTFLPYDIIYEILSHLSTIDILRTRRACKWLAQMTFHRAVWSAAHERSRLLLAEGPIDNQTSSDLEAALVRATKLSLVWTAHPSRPPPTMSRCLQKSYPVFSFEAALVGGRYLLTVENRRLCLFDLDATQRDGLKSPLLARETYWERKLISTCGMLCYQTNTRHDVVHVAFTQRGVIVIVEIQLSEDRAESELVAEIPAESVIKMCLRNGFLFFAEDFLSPHHPIRLYHVSTGRIYNLPIHVSDNHLH
ncbi:hypothetical protein AX14_000326 [Amanita brunnescens Koide BX004]|nr:hypothetical protein AX14_000326 [Amanita brunnescens Koide BX004]